MNDRFQIVGARPLPEAAPTKNRHSLRGKPVASAMILSLIALGCLFCELIMTNYDSFVSQISVNTRKVLCRKASGVFVFRGISPIWAGFG